MVPENTFSYEEWSSYLHKTHRGHDSLLSLEWKGEHEDLAFATQRWRPLAPSALSEEEEPLGIKAIIVVRKG